MHEIAAISASVTTVRLPSKSALLIKASIWAASIQP